MIQSTVDIFDHLNCLNCVYISKNRTLQQTIRFIYSLVRRRVENIFQGMALYSFIWRKIKWCQCHSIVNMHERHNNCALVKIIVILMYIFIF